MIRRFVCMSFDRGAISAYVAIAGNRPVRVMTLGCGDGQLMRDTPFDQGSIERFRQCPTAHGRAPDGGEAA
jgi:hypothetical protein